MSEEKITAVQKLHVEEELHTCPACDYTRGFHVSFVREGPGGEKALRVVLICPSCGARYDIDRLL